MKQNENDTTEWPDTLEKGSETAYQVERMVRPEFGEKVKFSRQLIRRKGARRKVSDRQVFYDFNFWEPVIQAGSGLFLGVSTLRNGIRDHDEDDGCSFRPTEYITAALISQNKTKNPIYVLLKDIEA